MRAPAFWKDAEPSLAARLLSPLAALYGAIAAARLRRPGLRAAVPVICIGNFTAGGAGKTPTALAIASMLAEAGERTAFLSRGYGGRQSGAPHLVDAERDIAADVGDEPLLLARRHPTFVCRDRVAGAAAACAAGAGVIVMDDGLQNPSLVKDVALAVVDAQAGIGNGLCLPAGPLRAPLARQWRLVAGLVLIGEGEAGARVADEAVRRGLPVFRAALRPDPEAAARLAGRDVVGFAGIGRPEKFFETLRDLGARIAEARAFGDHMPYRRTDLAALAESARQRGAILVTTEKDAARIGAATWAGLDCERSVLPVTLAFERPQEVATFLQARIAAARADR